MNSRQVSHDSAFLVVFVSAMFLSSYVFAEPPSGKGKKPPQGDSLPTIRYSIDVAPIPPSGTFYSWGTRDINHLGMVVGNYDDDADGPHAFLYHPSSASFYDLRLEPSLTDQLDALSPGFRFSRAYAINNAGVVTGGVYNPDTDVLRGFVLDTALSSDVADWVVHLLPDVEGWSYGVDINLWGEVAGYYERADQTRDRFVYNPFADPPQPVVTIGLSSTSLAPLANINDQSRLAQYFYTTGPIEVYDATAGSPPLNTFDLGRISDNVSFNNDGVVVAIKRDQKLGGKGKRYDILVQIDSATGNSENVITSSPFTLYAGGPHFLNNNGDIAFQNDGNADSGRIELVHHGFSPEFDQNVWNIDDLIADDDPWKADWVASWGTGIRVTAITDRSDQDDASGYPVMAGAFATASGVKCAVLTPHDQP